MTLNFLCRKHRHQLTTRPEIAINCWQNTFESGQRLQNQKKWKEAVPRLGCALEAAEIILTNKLVDDEYAYELFSCSASLLLDALKKLDQIKQSHEIYWQVIERFTLELANHPEAKASISPHMEELYQRFQSLGTVTPEKPFSSAFLHHFIRSAIH